MIDWRNDQLAMAVASGISQAGTKLVDVRNFDKEPVLNGAYQWFVYRMLEKSPKVIDWLKEQTVVDVDGGVIADLCDAAGTDYLKLAGVHPITLEDCWPGWSVRELLESRQDSVINWVVCRLWSRGFSLTTDSVIEALMFRGYGDRERREFVARHWDEFVTFVERRIGSPEYYGVDALPLWCTLSEEEFEWLGLKWADVIRQFGDTVLRRIARGDSTFQFPLDLRPVSLLKIDWAVYKQLERDAVIEGLIGGRFDSARIETKALRSF